MRKKSYRVTGEQPVAGHQPGSVFQHAFPPEQEAQLLAGGAIAAVKAEPAPKKPAPKKKSVAEVAAAPKPTRERQEA